MKAAHFLYHAPTSLEEATQLVHEYGEDAKPLAGGQSLVPLLAMRLTRFAHLVDLNTVPELAHITASEAQVAIGAMTRQAVIGGAPEIAEAVPLLARAIPFIGHFQIRNRGTIGGSIAHADPASELPAVALALDAEVEARSVRGTRRIPAAEFFVSTWQSALEPDELAVALHFARRGARSGFHLDELAWRSGDFAVAGVAVAVELEVDGRVARSGIALMGMGPTPLRARNAEQALLGADAGSADLGAIAALAVEESDPPDDVHAPAAYRRQVAGPMLEKALTSALEEAAHG